MTESAVDYHAIKDFRDGTFRAYGLSYDERTALAQEALGTDSERVIYRVRCMLDNLLDYADVLAKGFPERGDPYDKATIYTTYVSFLDLVNYTYPESLRIAKMLSGVVGTGIPIQSGVLLETVPLIVTPDTDVEAHWVNAIQDDQDYCGYQLRQAREKAGQPGWEWTTEYSQRTLEVLDKAYDLSNNMVDL